ncbi:MAG: hypothetical protein Q4A92_09625, partial [Corynebacterium sp.]|nr:hypothetical protein [Corynebacterium sp.]
AVFLAAFLAVAFVVLVAVASAPDASSVTVASEVALPADAVGESWGAAAAWRAVRGAAFLAVFRAAFFATVFFTGVVVPLSVSAVVEGSVAATYALSP